MSRCFTVFQLVILVAAQRTSPALPRLPPSVLPALGVGGVIKAAGYICCPSSPTIELSPVLHADSSPISSLTEPLISPEDLLPQQQEVTIFLLRFLSSPYLSSHLIISTATCDVGLNLGATEADGSLLKSHPASAKKNWTLDNCKRSFSGHHCSWFPSSADGSPICTRRSQFRPLNPAKLELHSPSFLLR